jgi:hypothetical protein
MEVIGIHSAHALLTAAAKELGVKDQIEGAVARPYCARSAPFL